MVGPWLRAIVTLKKTLSSTTFVMWNLSSSWTMTKNKLGISIMTPILIFWIITRSTKGLKVFTTPVETPIWAGMRARHLPKGLLKLSGQMDSDLQKNPVFPRESYLSGSPVSVREETSNRLNVFSIETFSWSNKIGRSKKRTIVCVRTCVLWTKCIKSRLMHSIKSSRPFSTRLNNCKSN